jgi:hypothetical protein
MATTELKQPKKPATLSGLRVHTLQDGFRRGGRAWHGTTDVPLIVLTDAQIEQIKAEPKLVVEEIDIEVAEQAGADADA